MNEFAHHGAKDEFGRLAGSGQAFAKAFPPIGSVERDHGRHVKRLAIAYRFSTSVFEIPSPL